MSGYIDRPLYAPGDPRIDSGGSGSSAWDAPNRSEQYHNENFTDEQMSNLEREMAERNAAIDAERAEIEANLADEEATLALEDEALLGEEALEDVELAAGPFGWIPAGATALMIGLTLATLGYTAYEIARLSRQAAALPPDSAIPIPPPGYVGKNPTIYYGVNPNLFFSHHKKKRINGLM